MRASGEKSPLRERVKLPRAQPLPSLCDKVWPKIVLELIPSRNEAGKVGEEAGKRVGLYVRVWRRSCMR